VLERGMMAVFVAKIIVAVVNPGKNQGWIKLKKIN